MKRIAPLTLGLFLCLYSFGQEISGIINHYAAISSIDSCAGLLTLSDTTGFAPGTAVLLIQMQGAAINTGNDSAFGDLTDLGGAGRYERNRIAARDGLTVTLENILLHTYDPAGKVQLVSIPAYDSVTVSAPLLAAAWDGSRGGVLVLEVAGALTLQADVDAGGRGFRGGTAQIDDDNNCNFLINQSDWYYPLDNWRGAAKGEGIAAFTPGREAGRGAQATGGGGGNDHNAGGGGGAQVTGGGQGGNNEEPSTFGCDGEFPGRGGKAAPDDPDRLYLGGGGGAGHENNNVATNGGHGGGIIIILAGTIEGNGFALRSNGADALPAGGDGGGGGGGGGTIVVEADQATNLLIEARGGKGADVNNGNQNRCFGPGGGGSGGRLLSSLPFPAANLSGGTAGQSLNSGNNGCSGSNGAAPGANGLSTPFDSIPAAGQLNQPPMILQQPTALIACPQDTLTINVETEGRIDTFQWQVDTGTGFTDLSDNDRYSGSNTPTLTINGTDATVAGFAFRLRLSNNCGEALTSQPVTLTLGETPTADFSFTLFGLAVQFQNLSTGADGYLWDFGDGNTSTSTNPVYGYPASGDYPVTLIAFNECGADTLTLTVSPSNQPVADFIAGSPTSGCAPLTVDFFNNSVNAVSYLWLFPGASPSMSTDLDATATYNIPGGWDVTLIVFNGVVYDTLAIMNFITVLDLPESSFTHAVNGGTVSFTDASSGADSYLWDFGDGNTSTEPNPSHTYEMSGLYEVTLTVTNDCGSSSSTQSVIINLEPVAVFNADVTSGCAPLTVSFTNDAINADSFEWSFPGGSPNASNLPDPTVVYATAGTYDATLIVSNASGADTLTLPGYLQVEGPPTAGFSTFINDLAVTFNNQSLDGNSYLWDFGDGNTSSEPGPNHTYGAPGPYTVTLIVSNSCGSDTTTQTITAGAPPLAGFTASPLSGCAPLTVQFSDQSVGSVENYAWTFPGGTPGTSTDPNPVVTYNTPGAFPVNLTVSGSAGMDTELRLEMITVYDLPVPAFDFAITDELTVSFTNLSSGATAYFWDFGDGNTSSEENPTHTYGSGGFYQVTLNALTPACGNAFSQFVLVGPTGTNNSGLPAELLLYPNPVRDFLHLAWRPWPPDTFRYRLFSPNGQVLRQRNDPPLPVATMDLRGLSNGVYFLEISTETGRRIEKVVKQ